MGNSAALGRPRTVPVKGELSWGQALTLCPNWSVVNVWVFPLGGLDGEVTVRGGGKQDGGFEGREDGT